MEMGPRGNEKTDGTGADGPIPVGVDGHGQPPAAEMRPRHAVADSFEQNPLSAVTARVTAQAIAGMSDSERVREALHIVGGWEGAVGLWCSCREVVTQVLRCFFFSGATRTWG